jgi:hypothetical protein
MQSPGQAFEMCFVVFLLYVILLLSLENMKEKRVRKLTAENVLDTCAFRLAVKTAPTKIRAITEEDVVQIGSSFLDLENRSQRVEVGRYLCIGVDGEKWTCSEKSMQERQAISEEDSEGFCLYMMRHQLPILATIVDEPFCLCVQHDQWESQEGAITWNGKRGDDLSMRVVARSIFDRTYQFLD